MPDQDNNQSQQQSQSTPTTSQQATTPTAQAPLEFINIETSRSVEMFKGSMHESRDTKIKGQADE